MLLQEKQTNEKTKWKKAKNPTKIVSFSGGHPKMRKMKEGGFLAKIA